MRFGDEVTDCTYANGRWQLSTASGHTDEVDVVIAATGVLHHPRYPDIEGMDSFAGAMLPQLALGPRRGDRRRADRRDRHRLDRGADRRRDHERVAHLTLFQRTAQWVMPQENPAYTDEEQASFRSNPGHLSTLHDNLSEAFGIFANAVVDADSPEIKLIEEACRANLEDNVHDPELREALRPTYRAACKRLIISPNFYDAIQQPNAELVTDGIERIEPAGVRTRDGRLHELDVLVLATGFKADAFMRPDAHLGPRRR